MLLSCVDPAVTLRRPCGTVFLGIVAGAAQPQHDATQRGPSAWSSDPRAATCRQAALRSAGLDADAGPIAEHLAVEPHRRSSRLGACDGQLAHAVRTVAVLSEVLVVELEDASPAHRGAIARFLLTVLAAAHAEAIVVQGAERALIGLARRVLVAPVAELRRRVGRAAMMRRVVFPQTRAATTIEIAHQVHGLAFR